MAKVTVTETGGNEVGYHESGAAHKVRTYYWDWEEGQDKPADARPGDRLYYVNWYSLTDAQKVQAGCQLWMYSNDWHPQSKLKEG